MVNESDMKKLVAHCESELGSRDDWIVPTGYPDSLALCLIDAIYSTGSHYTSVVNVVNRYRAAHGNIDGAQALLKSIQVAGGSQEWAVSVADNVKPAHTRAGAPLKAEVIEQAARLLVDLEIDTVDDLVNAVQGDPLDNPVHTGWKKLPSQSSGVTYNYLLLLAGYPSVKPDRMVVRFVEEALGGKKLTSREAFALVMAAAGHMDVNARALDHKIWRVTSGRDAPTNEQ